MTCWFDGATERSITRFEVVWFSGRPEHYGQTVSHRTNGLLLSLCFI